MSSGFRQLVFKNNSGILQRSSLRNKLFSSDGISHLVTVLFHGVQCFCFGCKLREEWRPVKIPYWPYGAQLSSNIETFSLDRRRSSTTVCRF